MQKKEKAAPQNGATMKAETDTVTRDCEINSITCKARHPTRLELACIHLLDNGPQGTSRVSASRANGDPDYRNWISELRRKYGIQIESETFDYLGQGGRVSHLSRYYLPNRDEARRAAELANLKRKERGAEPLSQAQIARYLAAFPAKQPLNIAS